MATNQLLNKISSRLGLDRELPCVIQLGLAFMFLFTGFDTQSFVSETALRSVAILYPGRISSLAGYYGMAITYGSFTLATFLTPLIVGWISAKWSMFIASLAYTAFMATFVLVTDYLYFTMSAIMGIAAALLWTAHGVYMKEITTSGNASRNSALHWSINLGSLLVGGAMLIIIFRFSGDSETMSMQAIAYIFEGLSAFTILSNITFLFLHNFSERSAANKAGIATSLGRTLNLLKNKKMLLLAVCFMYLGIELSFYLSIYPSCLSFAKRLVGVGNEIIAYYALANSVGQMSGGFFVSLMSKIIIGFGYLPTMVIAIVAHLSAFLGIYLTFPADANLHPSEAPTIAQPSLGLWLLFGLLLGVGDSCWNTIRTASLTSLFNEDCSQAFALSKFFQSCFTCASFFYTSILDLHKQLYIMTAMLLLGSVTFCVLWRTTSSEEFDLHKRRSSIFAVDAHKPSINKI